MLQAGLEMLEAKGVDNPTRVPCFIDVDATLGWLSAMVECCPCLTKRRCERQGHYLTTAKGMMTLREICNFQALPMHFHSWARAKLNITDSAFAAAVGNAMSVNVLMRLLPKVLYSAGMLADKPKLKRKFSQFLAESVSDTEQSS